MNAVKSGGNGKEESWRGVVVVEGRVGSKLLLFPCPPWCAFQIRAELGSCRLGCCCSNDSALQPSPLVRVVGLGSVGDMQPIT